MRPTLRPRGCSSTRIVYGPVLSWRLGRSLGVDPVLPPKTCTYNCVYCQLGDTVVKVSCRAEFKPRFRPQELRVELEDYVSRLGLESFDVVTFSGSGEPTLNPDLPELIDVVREVCPGKPVAILTNSSTLLNDEVVDALRRLDHVEGKLDAAVQEVFEQVNEPPEGLTVSDVVEGLRRMPRGRLVVQVMAFKVDGSPANYGPEALRALAEAIARVRPTLVHLNTPTRPPRVKEVSPLGVEELACLAKSLEESCGVRVVHYRPPRLRGLRLGVEGLLDVLKRRPLTLGDIALMVGGLEEASRIVGELAREGLVRTVVYRGALHYVA